MAVQASPNIEELRDRREKLIQELNSIQKGNDSPIQQEAYKSATSIADPLQDEINKLQARIAEIEAQIQESESESDGSHSGETTTISFDTSTNGSSTDSEDTQSETLTHRHGTVLVLARTVQPWLLPVNTLVISVGVQGGMQGGLSQALRHELGEDVWSMLRDQVQTAVSTITPKSPILINLDASLGSQLLPNAPELPDGRENGRYQIIAATPATPNSDVLDPETAAGAIIKLAVDNHITQLGIPLLGSGRAGLKSTQVAETMLKAIYWTIPETNNPLKQVILSTREDADDDQSKIVAIARRTINMLTSNRAQKLSADSVAGEDTLGIKTEVYALAETLLLRDVETPLAVGILGGWGSGKSFVMHLMQQEMMRLRSLEVSKGWDTDGSEPYVGHIYPIEFNAWTYAKSDLWASLMQTIFIDLNKQLSLEQLFTEESLKDGGANWLELNQLGQQELEALLETEVGADAVKNWQLGKTPDSLWVAYNEMRAQELAEMETVEQQRDQVELELQQLETNQQQQIEEEARQEVWQELVQTTVTSTVAIEIQNALKTDSNISEEDLEDLTKLGIKLKQVRPTMSDLWQWRNMLTMLWHSKWIILLALIFLLLPFAIEQFRQLEIYSYLMSWIGSIGAVLLAGFRSYQEWSEKVQQWLSGINDTLQLADEMMETEETKLMHQKQADMMAERQQLETDLDELNAQIELHHQRMGIAGEFSTLQDFVSARLQDRDYEERLGMLHRAQADLQELTDTLTVRADHDLHAEAKQKFFPRGPARVVLFIDDLDRCPPPKVVEVLEAVQLLLRTELFVVVLGLDTRYVTRALEKQYAGILQHHGDPSGLDYIEKIIQIPYRVRPVEPENLRTFLEAQMEMVAHDGGEESDGQEDETKDYEETTAVSHATESDDQADDGQKTPDSTSLSTDEETHDEDETTTATAASISPQVVKFHVEDFADLENACVSMGLTPRSIKRLINVLKLMKVFWFRTNQNKSQEEIQTVINLLTLSARYPEIMVQVFHNIELAFRDKNKAQEELSMYLITDLTNEAVLPQMEGFKTAVTNLNFTNITLNSLGLKTFHLVRSFSFVGDPVYTEKRP